VQQEWAAEELIESWTLVGADRDLVANKPGATRLGFAVLLKFYEVVARLSRDASEVPGAAVVYLADLVGVDAAEFDRYWWSSRSSEYHRAQIRDAFWTRPATEADGDRWCSWLAVELCPVETRRDRWWRRSF